MLKQLQVMDTQCMRDAVQIPELAFLAGRNTVNLEEAVEHSNDLGAYSGQVDTFQPFECDQFFLVFTPARQDGKEELRCVPR